MVAAKLSESFVQKMFGKYPEAYLRRISTFKVQVP